MKNSLRYTSTQILIHWLSALCVIFVILLPLSKEWSADYFGGRANLFMLHKSLGVSILLLTLIRLFFIIKQGVPELLSKEQKLQRILAKSVQGFLYLLLMILPLSGYLMSTKAINFFGLFNIANLTLPEMVRATAHTVHIFSAYLIIALILLHLSGALYHHFWLKDNVLKSMLPARWFS